MLSRTAEYALRAIVWLSDHPDSSVTGQAIAGATHVPPDYLAKVMQCLARAGLVEAQRGKKGGFTLVSAPDAITILDVINAVDPVRRIRSCPLGLAGHESLCPLHHSLDNIADQLERAYRGIRISDLLRSTGVKPLCAVAEVSHA
jgi:Rrf2 family transcriptional regulator, nitric oxide-sensitive transcriptional repressor